MNDGALRIGEMAREAGVSTRTIRYYEELGLLVPAGHSPGGARRYSDADLARLRRIRELQDVMGFGLEEIRTIVQGEDRLLQLRTEFKLGKVSPARQEQLVGEAIEINDRLRTEVKRKIARSNQFLAELEGKARRYRELLGRGSVTARSR